MADQATDERLLEQAANGNTAAFQILYERYRDPIFRFAYRLLGSVEAAEDDHFVHPVRVKGGRYLAPRAPGYSAEIKLASLERFEYPDGDAWAAVEHPMAEGSSMGT